MRNRLSLTHGLPRFVLFVSSSCLALTYTSVVLARPSLDIVISVCDLVVASVVVDGSVVVVGGVVVEVVVVVVVVVTQFGRVVKSVIPH